MKTQIKTKSPGLFILWVFLVMALLAICYLYNQGDSLNLNLKFNWLKLKKKSAPVEIVIQEKTKITLDEFVAEFVKENHSKISEGDFLSFEIPVEEISEEISEGVIVLYALELESSYPPGKVYPWVIKYRIPSVVRKVPGGTQLSVEYPFFLLEDTSVCYIEKKGNFPYIVVETNGKFWLFDQNLDELPRW